MTTPQERESDPVARFIATAERYCAWAEGPPADGSREAHTACVLVIDLLRSSIDLSGPWPGEPNPPSIADAEWRRVFARFESVSGARLHAAVEPTAPDQGVVWSDTHEDLADLWRDLRECLELIRAGHTDAGIHHWRFRFEFGWDVGLARLLHVLLPERRSTP